MFPASGCAATGRSAAVAYRSSYRLITAMADNDARRQLESRDAMRCAWVRCLWVALCVMACLGCLDARIEDGRAVELRAGRFILDSERSTPPAADDPRWVPVTLPDAWRKTRPEVGGRGWYHFELSAPAAARERWAVYLPAVNMSANAYVNGSSIGSGGSIDPPDHNFYRPLYFVFPGALLDRPINTIDVELGAISNHYGCLTPFWVGPDAALHAHQEQLYFARVTLIWLETFLGFVMAALMAALWRSSRDLTYGSFALAALLWSISSLNYWVRELPMSHWAWERLVHLSLFGFGVMNAFWVHRLFSIERPRVLRSIAALAALGIVTILILPVRWFYPTVSLIHILTMTFSGYAYAIILSRLGTLSGGERIIFLIGGVANLAFGAHDLAIMFGWLDQSSPYLLAHSAPILVLICGSSLTRRFALSLSRAERLNTDMERRIQEKHTQLEENFRKLGQLERDRVLSDERNRMIREMHDGLGSQLTSTLALIERGGADAERLSVALRGALAEMRLVIDSLDSEPRPIPEVLGVLRARLQPILRAAGLIVDWRMDERCNDRLFSPEESLHVLRIIQEAISNAVKHAKASRIEVCVSRPDGAVRGIRLTVADDGQGIVAQEKAPGRGLAHMRYRARVLGGDLHISSNEPGTRVALTLLDAGA